MVVIEAVASEPEVQVSDAVKISKHNQHHSDRHADAVTGGGVRPRVKDFRRGSGTYSRCVIWPAERSSQISSMASGRSR